MRVSHVVNAAAQGLVARSYHPNWADVNPVKRQHLTKEEMIEKRRAMDDLMSAQRKRQRDIKRQWPNSVILYTSK